MAGTTTTSSLNGVPSLTNLGSKPLTPMAGIHAGAPMPESLARKGSVSSNMNGGLTSGASTSLSSTVTDNTTHWL